MRSRCECFKYDANGEARDSGYVMSIQVPTKKRKSSIYLTQITMLEYIPGFTGRLDNHAYLPKH